MTLAQALRRTKDALAQSGIDGAAFEAAQMVAHCTGLEAARLLMCADTVLTPAQSARLERLIARRAAHTPLQYLLSEWSFYGLPFSCGPGVLIPRQDTETLVDCALSYLKDHPAAKVADLCAGSGAVAVSVAKNAPVARVWALEKEPAALAYLARNIERNRAGVTVLAADVFAPPADDYDLILCNPPYIPTGELDTLQREVRAEPRSALDGGADGLRFYRGIAAVWKDALRPGGQMMFEVGAGQAGDVKAILQAQSFLDCWIKKDYNGIERVVCAAKGGRGYGKGWNI